MLELTGKYHSALQRAETADLTQNCIGAANPKGKGGNQPETKIDYGITPFGTGKLREYCSSANFEISNFAIGLGFSQWPILNDQVSRFRSRNEVK